MDSAIRDPRRSHDSGLYDDKHDDWPVVSHESGFNGQGFQLPAGTFNAENFTWNSYNFDPNRATNRATNHATNHASSHLSSYLQTPEERKRSLLRSLTFTEIKRRLQQISIREARSCRWLLSCDAYLAWDPMPASGCASSLLTEQRHLLWIRGKPGAGKSTLIRFALDYAEEHRGGEKILSHFFHARGVEIEKSIEGMYRSFLVSLITDASTAEIDELLRRSGSEPTEDHWTVTKLENLITIVIETFKLGPMTWFVDALDECRHEQIPKMARFFNDLAETALVRDLELRICVASRHYPYIPLPHAIDLIVEYEPGHDQNISTFINEKLYIGHSPFAEQIRAEMRRRSQGVFIWVKLVADILQREYDRARLQDLAVRLQSIPDDLTELYKEVVEGRQEVHQSSDPKHQDRNLTILCFQLVLYAKKPLSPWALWWALHLSEATRPVDLLYMLAQAKADRGAISRYVLDVSKGLVEITTFRTQFIHESVRNFLLGDLGLAALLDSAGDDGVAIVDSELQSHASLRDLCHKEVFITAECIQIPTQLNDDEHDEYLSNTDLEKPFLFHAITHILHHTDALQGLGADQADYLTTFDLSRWAELTNFLELGPEPYEIPENSENLHIWPDTGAADWIEIWMSMDYGHLVRSCPLLEENRRQPTFGFVAADGRFLAPIVYALECKALRSIKALVDLYVRQSRPHSRQHILRHLEGRIDYDKLDTVGRTFANTIMDVYDGYDLPKHLESNSALATFILISLLPLAYFDEASQEAIERLDFAVQKGLADTLRFLLLERCLRLEMLPIPGPTLFHWSCSTGNMEIFELLLAHGMRPNFHGSLGCTPLHWAVKTMQEEIITRLLAMDQVDVNAREERGETPLHFACSSVTPEAPAAVKALLKAETIDVNAANKYGQTPLHCVMRDLSVVNYNSEINSEETTRSIILQLLVDSGKADITARDVKGRTPLGYAGNRADRWINQRVCILREAEKSVANTF